MEMFFLFQDKAYSHEIGLFFQKKSYMPQISIFFIASKYVAKQSLKKGRALCTFFDIDKRMTFKSSVHIAFFRMTKINIVHPRLTKTESANLLSGFLK